MGLSHMGPFTHCAARHTLGIARVAMTAARALLTMVQVGEVAYLPSR